MISRRAILFASAAVFATAAAARAAVVRQPFTPEAFAAAQAAGRPILVEVGAPWCPICRIQKIVLGPLLAQARFQDILVLEIDFDRQKDALRQVNARITSTLIIYRGEDEMGRSLGDTNPESVESLLTMAL